MLVWEQKQSLAGFYMRETATKAWTRSYREVEEESSEMSSAFGHPLLDNARQKSMFVEWCREKSRQRLARDLDMENEEKQLKTVPLV